MPSKLNPLASETVLVVDDDHDMCWVLERALGTLGCGVTSVGLGASAISIVTERDFPIAFVDARLPDMDGLRLIMELRVSAAVDADHHDFRLLPRGRCSHIGSGQDGRN